jgi:hypothetical protein
VAYQREPRAEGELGNPLVGGGEDCGHTGIMTRLGCEVKTRP